MPTVDFAPLLRFLGDLFAQYEKVCALSEQKKDLIIAGDVAALEASVREETTELLKAGAIEKKRAAAAEKIAAELFPGRAEITLADFIEIAPEPEKTELSRLWSSFSELVKRLSQVNNLNRQLLETNVAYTEMMLGVFAGTNDPLNNLYRGDGAAADDSFANPGFFDQQI